MTYRAATAARPASRPHHPAATPWPLAQQARTAPGADWSGTRFAGRVTTAVRPGRGGGRWARVNSLCRSCCGPGFVASRRSRRGTRPGVGAAEGAPRQPRGTWSARPPGLGAAGRAAAGPGADGLCRLCGAEVFTGGAAGLATSASTLVQLAPSIVEDECAKFTSSRSLRRRSLFQPEPLWRVRKHRFQPPSCPFRSSCRTACHFMGVLIAYLIECPSQLRPYSDLRYSTALCVPCCLFQPLQGVAHPAPDKPAERRGVEASGP